MLRKETRNIARVIKSTIEKHSLVTEYHYDGTGSFKDSFVPREAPRLDKIGLAMDLSALGRVRRHYIMRELFRKYGVRYGLPEESDILTPMVLYRIIRQNMKGAS